MHKEYIENLPIWEQIRDVLSGARKVKEKGQKYLPSLSDQTDAEYDAYKMRANFVNLTAKVLQSLTGQIVSREPIYENIPDEFIEVCSIEGQSIYEVIGLIAEELIAFSRVGIMQDFSSGRASTIILSAESVIDWKYDFQEKKLLEVHLQFHNDPLNDTEVASRKLYLEDGVYKVDSEYNSTVINETITPLKDGKPLDFIPFTMLTQNGLKFGVDKTLFEDITDINLSHFRTSADLEQGRHFVSLPTPVVTGANEDTVLKIGSTTAWIIPDEKAKAYYLEFQGSGLKSLETAMQEKQSQIALFSAKIIETNSKGSEAAETVRLRYSSEAASLSTIARVIERGLTINLGWQLWWSGIDTEKKPPKVTIIKQFLSTKLTAAEITALNNTYLDGSISQDTFIDSLLRGSIITAKEAEKERKRVKKNKKSETGEIKKKKKTASKVRAGAFDNITDPDDKI